ncbi:ATP-binding protein [Sphaerisporangium viridialbum]|uniref:ATP-binding protein n=1 Tax=Sphaerisporangium viridialbum TaxID=46189 RepID=UPI003C7880A2
MRTAELLGRVELPGKASAVAAARACVRGLLCAAGYSEADQVELLVSELMANSVRHSDSGRDPCGMVRLVVSHTGDALRVEVIDEGSSGAIPPVPAQVDPLSESGRGLWLVRELSSFWGWKDDETGRVVWFEMAAGRSG